MKNFGCRNKIKPTCGPSQDLINDAYTVSPSKQHIISQRKPCQMIWSFLFGHIQVCQTWRPQATSHTCPKAPMNLQPKTFADEIMFQCKSLGNALLGQHFLNLFSCCQHHSCGYIPEHLLSSLLSSTSTAFSNAFLIPLVTVEYSWNLNYLKPSLPKHPFSPLNVFSWWTPNVTKIKAVICFWPIELQCWVSLGRWVTALANWYRRY